MIEDAPNLNILWGGLIVEELIRNGVTVFCISPGSRSTPLTLAAAGHPKAETFVHFDERGMAYHALGVAKASEKPAALICTSGTAAANYFPAVVEASQSGVPLILLTADRPPELIDCGANQAIDQVNLFGRYARWTHHFPCPAAEIPPQYVLTTINQAVHRAIAGDPGPVHLNCPFREPLGPEGGGVDDGAYLSSISRWRQADSPYTEYAGKVGSIGPQDIYAILDKVYDARGLLVIGELTMHGEEVIALAKTLNWPVFLDISANVPQSPALRRAHDLALLSAQFRRAFRPEVILHVGGPLTSKHLAQFIEECANAAYIRVAPAARRLDSSHDVSYRIECDIGEFSLLMESLYKVRSREIRRGETVTSFDQKRDPSVSDLIEELQECVLASDSSHLRSMAWGDLRELEAASDSIQCVLSEILEAQDSLSEPLVARLISRHMPKDSWLFLANSMPIRDMNMFAVAGGPAARVAVNRGASGIDGNLATAVGLANGSGLPVTALLGDLALLHDLNSLALVKNAKAPVIIVVLNNDGGGIFNLLPIANANVPFERYWGTPHGLRFKDAAAMFGIEYDNPETRVDFIAVYTDALAQGRSALIEVNTSREENRCLHAEIQRKIIEALDRK